MKLTLMMLANNHHLHHDQCQVSQDKLALETEQSVRTIRTQLKRLEADGIIKRVRTFDARGGRGEDEYILLGLTKLTEEEINIRARAKLPTPYRKDLPVGSENSDENPSGNLFPVGPSEEATQAANIEDPTGKYDPPYRQHVAGTYKENRKDRIDRKDLTVVDTRARETGGCGQSLGAALNALKPQIGDAAWRAWIAPLKIISHDPPAVEAPTRFHATRVRQDFVERLERMLGNRLLIEIRDNSARRAGGKTGGTGR